MKHLRQKSPVQQVFILVFITMIFYRLMTSLPFIPELVMGFPFTKIMKIVCGLAFSLGVLLVYLLHKKADHGTGH
ncbi:hypothetical protein OKW21_001109 [Catalinimonas alkaloidigena]|uniref:hypothetical protein n=1 Tax=Catalinimonas alkaloidigena TaxID=1075417 RepID=UPI0024073800|nr:hypothetical protein [Catalinimonas alkaloidigena]MDF9795846.1 hypothetical protein [Catalinimonas alkaloidigena]